MSRRHPPAEEPRSARRELRDRTEACFGLNPQRFIADSAYGSAGILAWLLDEKNIAPHVPVWDKSERADGTFSRSDFLFDSVSNTYTCPGGKILQQYRRPFAMPRTGVTKNNKRLYRASRSDCAGMRPQGQMLPGQPQLAFMRLRARSPEASAAHPNTSRHAASGRRSRCCLRISSASSNSIACDCAARRGAKDEFLLAAIAEPAQAGQDGRAAADVRHIREWHELGGTGTDRSVGSPRSPARDPKQQPHRHAALIAPAGARNRSALIFNEIHAKPPSNVQ